MQKGVLLLGEHTPAVLGELAQLAESLDYDVLWYADEKFYRDVYVGLTAMAMRTQRIHLGTCVTEPYARHPALTAVALATLDELSGGRAILGLGAGGSGFPAMGLQRTRPAVALREAVEVMRRLWRGEVVDYQGEIIACHHGQLNFPVSRLPEIVIGSRGHYTLRMAGAVADGVMIAPYASRPGLTYAIERIRQGAQKRSSPPRLIARVDLCVSDATPHAARQAVKPMIALALWNSFPHYHYLKILNLDVPASLHHQLARRDYNLIAPSAALVPDTFVRHLAVAGNRQEAIDQLQEIAATGVDQITVHPMLLPGQTWPQVLEEFAVHLMPQVRP